MPDTNLIFLDIDGVLNCELFYLNRVTKRRSELSHESANICPKRLRWVADLCQETNSQLVISSTWRLGKTPAYFADTFAEIGGESTAGLVIAGLTPDIHGQALGEWDYPSIPRGVEIKHFLNNYAPCYRNYAILDDDADMLLEQGPHFFQTDPYAGLTPFTCQRIQDFFKK
jgi:hypothetical protein